MGELTGSVRVWVFIHMRVASKIKGVHTANGCLQLAALPLGIVFAC